MADVTRDALEICPTTGKIITRITWDRYSGGWFAYRINRDSMTGDGDSMRWEKIPLNEWLVAIEKMLNLKAARDE